MSQSRRQIFLSTTLVGGAQVISIGLGILRNKVLAILLGPAGVGLAGLYTSIPSLITSVSGMGIPVSGVRQIADSASKQDGQRVATTVSALSTITWIGGLVGMFGVILFAPWISHFTFGDQNHTVGIRIIAMVVLIEGLGAKQRAILQGLRRIKELSICQVLGAFGGAVVSLPLIYFLREQGVPWFLVVASACSVIASWFFVQRIHIERVTLSPQKLASELKALLNVGLAAVVTGFFVAALFYLTRLLITNKFGLDAVGLYQATCTLSLSYVGLVLGAMGTDYYPRLASIAKDHPACNGLINDQTEMGLLLVLPGILATLVLTPWILQAIYTSAFITASDVMRWQILGDGLKVVSWPLGFIALAKGRGGLFMLVEGSFTIIQLAIFWLCIQKWQFEGAGIALFAFYAIYTVGIFCIAKRLTNFSWEKECRNTIIIAAIATGSVFALCRYTSPSISLPIGLAVTALSMVWSYARLKDSVGINFVDKLVTKVAGLLRRGSSINRSPAGAAITAPESSTTLDKASVSKETIGYLISGTEQVYYVAHHAPNPIAKIVLAGHFAAERPFSYAPWVRWARYLAEHQISALRFDYRGCGESTGVFHNYTFSSWIDDCRDSYAFMKAQNPDIPIVLSGLGMGGLLISQLFNAGIGDAMLLWSPSANGVDTLRDTFFKRMAFDLANPQQGGLTTWAQYQASLEQGNSIEAAGYTITSQLWREAVNTKLLLPPGNSTEGSDSKGRPWKVVKLGLSETPLVAGGGLWQALNPGLRVRRAPLNPDLRGFFEMNTHWLRGLCTTRI